MELGRVVSKRLLSIEDGRKLLVLNADPLECLLGCLKRFRGYGGHAFADEPHPLIGQYRLIVERLAEPTRPNIRAGEDGVHAGHRSCCRGVDRTNQRVRKRAGEESGT